jgi:hypothetical protein
MGALSSEGRKILFFEKEKQKTFALTLASTKEFLCND